MAGLRFGEAVAGGGGGTGKEPSGRVFNEASARSWKVAVSFLGIVGLHLRVLRVQLSNPDESREVHSHSQNNCSCKTAPAQSGGREVKEVLKIKSLMLSLYSTKGPFTAGKRGFSPCLSALPTFIEPILNFILIYKSRGGKM